jgi:hypothetical protein
MARGGIEPPTLGDVRSRIVCALLQEDRSSSKWITGVRQLSVSENGLRRLGARSPLMGVALARIYQPKLGRRGVTRAEEGSAPPSNQLSGRGAGAPRARGNERDGEGSRTAAATCGRSIIYD